MNTDVPRKCHPLKIKHLCAFARSLPIKTWSCILMDQLYFFCIVTLLSCDCASTLSVKDRCIFLHILVLEAREEDRLTLVFRASCSACLRHGFPLVPLLLLLRAINTLFVAESFCSNGSQADGGAPV